MSRAPPSTDVVAGSLDEGASTITQQYVDNTLLRDERTDRTFRYKIREMYLAMELEKRRSKDEILELYLNTIYFGEGAYGAQAAAKTYFAKDAKDLTLRRGGADRRTRPGAEPAQSLRQPRGCHRSDATWSSAACCERLHHPGRARRGASQRL